MTAICHHLFTKASKKDIALLLGLLEQSQDRAIDDDQLLYRREPHARNKLKGVVQQIATNCVKEETVIQRVIQEILQTRNAVVYSSLLNVNYLYF